MNRRLPVIVLSLLACLGASPIHVRVSPHGGGPELVAWNIDSARSTLVIASYQWSSPQVQAATLRAKARGVRVRVILDPTVEHAPMVQELIAAGFTSDELRIDHEHAIFHHKLTLRDPENPRLAVYTNGSMNQSIGADTRNAENVTSVGPFPEAAEVAAFLLADMEKHWAHSRPVKVKPAPGQ